jgi:hypothetical protein
VTQSTAQGLANLAARLTKPEDRETYAGLVSYFHSLPEHDELFHLVELLGLLTLLGQHLPDALADAMTELRQLTERAGAYYGEIDERLAGLPGTITAGVDVSKIAKDMGEAFRQQIAASGLEISAAHLRNASAEIKALSDQVSQTLKPISQEYKTISVTLAGEITKLTGASGELRNQNARLVAEQQSASWWWIGTAALVLFLLGGLGGMFLERQQTADVLNNMSAQMERLQAPAVPVAVAPVSKRSKRQKGTGE